MKNSTFLKYTTAYSALASTMIKKFSTTTTASTKSLETYEKVKEKHKN
jgi:hypothetical protein